MPYTQRNRSKPKSKEITHERKVEIYYLIQIAEAERKAKRHMDLDHFSLLHSYIHMRSKFVIIVTIFSLLWMR